MASRSWNRIELIGNLTRDPELRFTSTGAAVATIGIATNRTYVSEGERKEEVDFHKIVAWNKLAELVNQLLKKGSRVFISGRLQYREWETQDGQKRRDAEIVLEDMVLLTPKGGFGGDEAGESFGGESDRTSEEKVSRPEVKKEEPAEEVREEVETPAEKEEEGKPVSKKPDETVSDDDLPF